VSYSQYPTPLPDQTGNSGKYLSTDGTTPSWTTISLSTNNITAAPPPSSLTLSGSVVTSGTAVAVIIDNTNALSTSGDKLLSLRVAGSEKAYVDRSGSLVALSVSATASGSFDSLIVRGDNTSTNGQLLTIGSDVITSGIFDFNSGGPTPLPVRFRQTLADGASSVAYAFDTSTAWSNAGAKLLSIRTGGTEQLSVNTTGDVKPTTSASASLGGSSNRWLAGWFDTANVTSINATLDSSHTYLALPVSASSPTLQGWTADGAAAISVIINAATSLATSTARIVSFQNAGTEKAWVDSTGIVHTPQVMGTGNTNTRVSLAASNPTIVAGDQANGASAIGVTIRTGVAYSTAGSKIISFQNSTTEKAFVSQAGLYGGTVGTATLAGTTSAATATVSNVFGRLTCGASGLLAAATITVTNTVCTATSIITVVFENTASTYKVAPGAGSFVITVTTAQNASDKISFALQGAGN